MAVSTIYDVKVKFGVEDKASSGIFGLIKAGISLGAGMRLGEKAVDALGSAFKHAVVDGIKYENQIDQINRKFETMLRLHSNFSNKDSASLAGIFTKDIEQAALAGAGTVDQLSGAAAKLLPSFAAAGGSMDDLKQTMSTIVPLATAFGFESDAAATTIQKALKGTLNAKDQFANALGIIPAEFNKLAKENPQAALQKMILLLRSPAIQEAASKQTKDLDNTLVRLQQIYNMISKAFASGPGAKLGDMLSKLADNIVAHLPEIEAMAASIGNMFTKMIDDSLYLFGVLTGSGDDWLQGIATTFDVIMGTIKVIFSAIGNVLKVIYNIFHAVETSAFNLGTIFDNLGAKLGALLSGGDTSKSPYQYKAFDFAGLTLPDLGEMTLALDKVRAAQRAAHGERDKKKEKSLRDRPLGDKEQKNVKVTINRLEVASDDPDRFAFNLVSAFQDFTKSPSQAANALREG